MWNVHRSERHLKVTFFGIFVSCKRGEIGEVTVYRLE